MEEYCFKATGMTVGYDGTPLIKEINFGVKKGEILTLIGPNGAGKSTILKSITVQLSLIAGTVSLEGQDLVNMEETARARRCAVVLTGKISTDLLTVREIVEMGRFPYTRSLGILSDADRRITENVMDKIGITALSDREFSRLSDGQKQRVMLARALAQEPEILVLDEPISYLDIGYQIEFLSLIKRMAKEEKLTVIMSLHELDQAQWISDMVLCIKGEYIHRFAPADEVFTTEYISELYDVTQEDLKRLGDWRG